MNAVIEVSKSALEDYLSSLEQNNLIIKIEGMTTKTYQDYSKKMAKELRFPTSCENSIDAYLDWMTDLSWLESNNILIVFDDYDDFMSSEPKNKRTIIDTLREVVLPFWESEVEEVVVNGKRKIFKVLLVK